MAMDNGTLEKTAARANENQLTGYRKLRYNNTRAWIPPNSTARCIKLLSRPESVSPIEQRVINTGVSHRFGLLEYKQILANSDHDLNQLPHPSIDLKSV
ncbi:unnamed protein product [Ambrosiozyma monospora]|uniref:Unnamed protein product n=1 Tax=Ambrosiozyma monospora TaxID=43982 RepID=A0A9W6YW55_AMBMO|nr:unnamed protein product [Ambrosiozyma monospora]